jgi:hypothetical protein
MYRRTRSIMDQRLQHGAHMDNSGLVTRTKALGYIDPVEKTGVAEGRGEIRSPAGLETPDEPEVCCVQAGEVLRYLGQASKQRRVPIQAGESWV